MISLSAVQCGLRLIPRAFPGKLRLARWLLKNHLGEKDLVLQDSFGCSFKVPNIEEPIGFHLLVNASYEYEIVQFVLSGLPKNGVFLDVGANIGVFAIPIARALSPAGQVVAFEASPNIYRYLEENHRMNGLHNLRCWHGAVCDREGSVDFFEAPINQFGMGSLSPQFDAHSIKVPGQTLDRLVAELGLTHVHMIKIDVEGLEQKVLLGAEKILRCHQPPLLVFEFCDWAEARVPDLRPGAAQAFLRDCGFQIWRLHDFIQGRPALAEPIRSGSEMLVAQRRR